MSRKRAGEAAARREDDDVTRSGYPERDAAQRTAEDGPARMEAADKVTGTARYSADLRLPGQLYAAVLRSPHPHAQIERVSTAAAEALPGVRAVLTHENAPDIPWHRGKLLDRRLRYVGDEVAAVAADDLGAAEHALRLIEVDYRVLPFALSAEAALDADAPEIHAGGNRVGPAEVQARGNVGRGFRDADIVLDRVYTTATALHTCMEPHGCTVRWESGELTVWESTQGIHAVRDELAEKLGLSVHRVRVVARHIGGGFGSKLALGKHTVLAAQLARMTARPVQLVLDRESENLATGNRNSTRQHVRIGAKRDGRLTAIEATIDVAIGADQAGAESSDVAGIYRQLYECPNLRTTQTGVFTNLGPASAFRAPGYVEGAFGLESAVDELARRLEMDPLDLRLRNYASRDQTRDLPYSAVEGLRRCYERAAETFDWGGRGRSDTANAKRRGLGMAAHVWIGGGAQPPAYAWVKLHHDGSAEVITGSQDIGTGTRTALAQIAAEELDLPLDRISLRIGDTSSAPYAPASGGSGTLATMGPAVRGAAADARAKLAAAQAHEAPHPRMALGYGEHLRGPQDRSVRTFGVQCVEVEVDVETAEVTVIRVVAAHDCGRIVNPALVRSQVLGGVTQGLGFALTEERVVDAASGIVLNASFDDYRIPTIADCPDIVHAPVDVPDADAGSLGIKGIGEPPMIPTAPAIANAIYDATGARLRDAPLSRRRLLSALQDLVEDAADEAVRI